MKPLNRKKVDHLDIGLKFHQERQHKKALESYKKVRPKDRQYPDSLHLQGLIAKDMGEVDQALALMTKAIELDPKSLFYGNRGGVLATQRQYKPALVDYLKAIELDPKNLLTIYNTAALYKQIQEPAKALPYLYRCLELNPEYVPAKQMIAMIRLAQDPDNPETLADIIESISMLQDVLKEHPNDFENWKTLAYLSYTIAPRCIEEHRAQIYGYAIEAYEKCAKLSPRDLQVLNNLAAAYKDSGQRQECVNVCHRALSVNREYTPTLHNLANTLHDMGRIRPALHYSSQAIKSFKGPPEELAMLTSSYLFTYLCFEYDFEKVANKFKEYGQKLEESLCQK